MKVLWATLIVAYIVLIAFVVLSYLLADSPLEFLTILKENHWDLITWVITVW